MMGVLLRCERDKLVGITILEASKKGQLGHPDEIRAKKISLGRQMKKDEHGLKRKFVSPSAR